MTDSPSADDDASHGHAHAPASGTSGTSGTSAASGASGTPGAPDAAAFDRARQRFTHGLASLKAGQAAEAEAHFGASLHDVPGRVSTLVNLAAARLVQERFEPALEAADAVLAAEPANRDGWFHRANALAGLWRLDAAAQAYARALAIDDRQAEIWLRHAETLHALERRDEALAAYRRGLALAPRHGGAWARCADILREQHRLGEAAHALRQAIAHGADDELTRYALAAVTPPSAQAPAPARSPPAYVRRLFDGYAGDFDRHLVDQLGYQAHQVLVRQALAAALRPIDAALDLGCGTGLCGPLLRPAVRRLVGVDLSPAMLDKARALSAYDALLQADALDHLGGCAAAYDLVVAADVLIYLGELTPLFTVLQRALRPGALFAFSVELPPRAGPDGSDAPDASTTTASAAATATDSTAAPAALDVVLQPSLRYAHAEPYLRRLAAAHGFAVVAALREPLRRDQRVPIDGLYMALRKP